MIGKGNKVYIKRKSYYVPKALVFSFFFRFDLLRSIVLFVNRHRAGKYERKKRYVKKHTQINKTSLICSNVYDVYRYTIKPKIIG